MTLYNVYVEINEPVEGWQAGIIQTGLEKEDALTEAGKYLDQGFVGVMISEVPE